MQFKHSQSDTVMSCDDILRARRHGLTDKPASPPRNEDFLPTFIAMRSMNINMTDVCALWSVVPKLGWGIIYFHLYMLYYVHSSSMYD